MGGISPTNAFDKGKIVIPVLVERHGIEELHVFSGDSGFKTAHVSEKNRL